MGLIKKFKDYFLEEDYEEYEEYEEDYEEEEEKQQATKGNAKSNVVSLQSVQKSSKVVLIEPRAYAEAQEIADHLKNRRAVVVNLQRIQHEQAKRIVDFLSGTVYAIGGDIYAQFALVFEHIDSNLFVCANYLHFDVMVSQCS